MDVFNYCALVVDDEPAVRQLLTRHLAMEGFRCHQAHDGRSGLELFRQGNYDLVVADLRMPQHHGYSLIQHILASKMRPALVVLTGVCEPKLVRRLLHDGVDDIVFKPVDLTLFSAKMRALVEARPHQPEDIEPRRDERHDEEPSAMADVNETRVRADTTAPDRTSASSRQGAAPVAESPASALDVARKQTTAGDRQAPLVVRRGNEQALRALLERSLTVRSTVDLPLPSRKFVAVAGLVLLALITSSLLPKALRNNQSPAAAQESGNELTLTLSAMQLPQALSTLKQIAPSQNLTIRGSDFTDREMRDIAQLPNVRGLDLSDSAVTDEGLAELAEMSSLTRLDLQGTNITSAGIQHISSLPNLTDLNVSHTSIDDDALEVITRMPKLKIVDVSGNVLSTPFVERIRRRRPSLTVLW